MGKLPISMRIAIFSESYEPIINGVSVCVSTLRDSLRRRGHDVWIFAARYPGHKDSYDRVIRIRSLCTFFMPTYPIPLPCLGACEKHFRNNPCDIIHTQTPFVLGLMGLRLGRKHALPVVSTNHTLYTEYAHYVPVIPKRFTKWIIIKMLKWYYNRCSVVVVPSQPIAKVLRSYGITTRLEVIKTGVDPIESSMDIDQCNRARERIAGTAQGYMLLYVGRVAREKNLTMLLRAFRRVIDSNIDARLVIVGGGPALKETKHFAESLELGSDRVLFTGMMAREDIGEVYHAADVFVFPSTTETQGLAICEAMTAGLPVVAVNAGGIPENVTDGVDGYLTENSPEEFANRIIELLQDADKRSRMGSAARVNSARFTVSYMIDRMLDVYRSVLPKQ